MNLMTFKFSSSGYRINLFLVFDLKVAHDGMRFKRTKNSSEL